MCVCMCVCVGGGGAHSRHLMGGTGRGLVGWLWVGGGGALITTWC